MQVGIVGLDLIVNFNVEKSTASVHPFHLYHDKTPGWCEYPAVF
jgi:hypothetical protein